MDNEKNYPQLFEENYMQEFEKAIAVDLVDDFSMASASRCQN